MKIFNYEPVVLDQDRAAISDCISSGVANPKYLRLFESKLSDVTGGRAICSSSGTAALHLSLLSLGIGPGDEVICPEISFAATWNVIKYVGATPVFTDIDPETWCISSEKIQEKITERTKAIISVDLYGNPCSYREIEKICKANKLYLICDSAQAMGSTYEGAPVGSFGDITCFSFNLNKVVTALGGGAIVLNNDKLEAQPIINKINQDKIGVEYDYSGVGHNYRMSPLNCAVGYSQMLRMEAILDQKEKIASWYREDLEGAVVFQKIQPGSISNNWFLTLSFQNNLMRESVCNHLNRQGIETKRAYKPASMIEWVKKSELVNEDFGNAFNFYKKSLTVPCGLGLSREDIHMISKEIKSVI